MPLNLTPERARVYRITHVANLPGLLANGIPCAAAAAARDARFMSIGNPDLINKRMNHPVPIAPGGTLADYVPFYFTPKSPMLYNIRTGWNGIRQRSNDEIAILASSFARLSQAGVTVLFTDRHAYTPTAAWHANPRELGHVIDWDILRRHDFTRDPRYPDKMERYQAEALAHRHVPVAALIGIATASETSRARVDSMVKAAGLTLPVRTHPEFYFP